MTLPTPASVTLPVPRTLTAALTMAVSARGTACRAGGSVGEEAAVPVQVPSYPLLCFRATYDPSLPCECNDKCSQYGNCCPDYVEECDGGGGGSLSDEDLKTLSEMLLSDDANNVGGMIELNLQCTTNNGNPQVNLTLLTDISAYATNAANAANAANTASVLRTVPPHLSSQVCTPV